MKKALLILVIACCLPLSYSNGDQNNDPRRQERHDDWPPSDETGGGDNDEIEFPDPDCYVTGNYMRDSQGNVNGCVGNGLQCEYSIPCN